MFRGWRMSEKEFFEEFMRDIEEMNSLLAKVASEGNEPLVYGFSLHLGSDGVPRMEHFGNVRPQAWQDDVREPFTSYVIDEKNRELIITAEMPGIGKEDIELNATEGEVIIKAEACGRKYNKLVRIPSPIESESAAAKYNNGVLEVTFKLKETKGSKGKGKTIKVE